MDNQIPQLYTPAQKRLLPIRDRIMDAIYDSSEDDLTVSEIIGLLEVIKFELLMTESGRD